MHPATEHVIAATDVVRAAIQNTQGPLPPAFIVEFLVRVWRRVLAEFHASYGPASKTWTVGTATMERLLWSAAPKPDPARRVELMQTLRPLVDDLRAGMMHIGVLPHVQDEFLDRLSEYHLRILQPDEGLGGDRGDISGTHLTNTIPMDLRDPQYRHLMDLLDSAEIEEIQI
jgi:hypothetical protein